jgi:deoxyuridine 5'-triphosphate nucleotidohydrolase
MYNMEKINTAEKAYFLGFLEGFSTTGNQWFSGNASTLAEIQAMGIVSSVERCEDIPGKFNFCISTEELKKKYREMLELEENHVFWTKTREQFPKFQTEQMGWSFLLGFLEASGCLISRMQTDKTLEVCLPFRTETMRKEVSDFVKIPWLDETFLTRNFQGVTYNKAGVQYFTGDNALDLLGKLYENSPVNQNYYRKIYLDWAMLVPGFTNNSIYPSNERPYFKWSKTRPDAVRPQKARVTDSGYDLVLLEKIKTIGVVELYETGIKVIPPVGWYFDVVPRSSITKSGYILANSVGIIDKTYTGSIKVPLIKINKDAPDLELPLRLVQLIPRMIVHFDDVEIPEEELGNTSRGSGGFGSTGK